MSRAAKCDSCSKLFVPTAGCVTLDVHQQVGFAHEERATTWADVEFCQKCSEDLIKVIRPAVNDIVTECEEEE